MARETEIEDFKILLLPPSEWRGQLKISSRVREKNDEYFNSGISLLIENYNTTPDEIKKEVFEKLKQAFVEITEWLKSQAV